MHMTQSFKIVINYIPIYNLVEPVKLIGQATFELRVNLI